MPDRPEVINGGVFGERQSISTVHTTPNVAPLAGTNRAAYIFSSYESSGDRGHVSTTWAGVTADLVGQIDLNSGGIRKTFVHRILEADYPSVAGAVETTYDGNVNNDSLVAIVQLQFVDQTTPEGAVASEVSGAGTTTQITPTAADGSLTIAHSIGDDTATVTPSGATAILEDYGNPGDLSGTITADPTEAASPVSPLFTIDSSDAKLTLGFAVNFQADAGDNDQVLGRSSDASSARQLIPLKIVGFQRIDDVSGARSIAQQKTRLILRAEQLGIARSLSSIKTSSLGRAQDISSARLLNDGQSDNNRPEIISGGAFGEGQTGVITVHTTPSVAPLAGLNRAAYIFSSYESVNDAATASVTWAGVVADQVGVVSLNDGGIRKTFVHRILEADYPSVAGAVETTYDVAVNNDSLVSIVQLQFVDQTTPEGAVETLAQQAGTTIQITPSASDNSLTLIHALGDETNFINQSGGTTALDDYGNVDDLLAEITADPTEAASPVSPIFTFEVADSKLAIGFSVNSAADAQDVIGRADEIGDSREIVPNKSAGLSRASSSSAARSIDHAKSQVIGRAESSSRAGQLVIAGNTPFGRAAELDNARPLSATRFVDIGRAAEISDARSVSAARVFDLNRASDSSDARTIASVFDLAIGRASASDQARSFASRKTVAIGRASSLDTARPVVTVFAASLGRASSVDVASALSVLKSTGIERIDENDQARRLLQPGDFSFERAIDASQARSLASVKIDLLGRASQADQARAFIALAESALARFQPIPGPVFLVDEDNTVLLVSDEELFD